MLRPSSKGGNLCCQYDSLGNGTVNTVTVKEGQTIQRLPHYTKVSMKVLPV